MSIRKRPAPQHNWNGVKTSTLQNQLINGSKGHEKKGKKVHGFVTKNHASTIVKERKTRDGKVVYDYVGETHDLPKKTQAALANALDNPKTSKVYLYDAEQKEGKK